MAERRTPRYIAEYDFREVWEADMAVGGPGSGGGGRRSWDLMSTPPVTADGEVAAGIGEGEGEREGEADVAAISAAVNRTLLAANTLLGMRSGSEASQTGEPETAGEGTESISQQIDRTLARAHALISDMDAPQPAQDQASTTHADTEPRQGRGGRRGRGRGYQGGN